MKESPMAFESSPGRETNLAPPIPAPSRFAAMRVALARKACEASIAVLNRILADTMTLRDLYKKYYWQASGATFYELHVLFDEHHEQQEELIDAIAERIRSFGGLCIAMAAEVAETTTLARPPRSREETWQQLTRLVEAHQRVLYGVRAAARRALDIGDDGTHELLAIDVIPVNENQAWRLRNQLQRGTRSANG
jgi:starvation-inducible DNA-binding protein